jgi:uncharacterized membrane protein YGL010W
MELESGKFDWVKRMGVHLAFHTNPINKTMHLILIPFELMGAIALIGRDPLEATNFFSYPSLITILLLGMIYVQTDIICGATFTGFLVLLQAAVFEFMAFVGITGGWRALFGLGLFVVFGLVQTQIGHKKFEPEGRDDTEKNVVEFQKTGRPIPLLLIFYYHWVEVFFMLGYKPELKSRVEFFRDSYKFPEDSEPLVIGK